MSRRRVLAWRLNLNCSRTHEAPWLSNHARAPGLAPARARGHRRPLSPVRYDLVEHLVRAGVRSPVFAGGADRLEPRGAPPLHVVFVVARRVRAGDLLLVRPRVRLDGREVAGRRAAAPPAPRHPPEYSGPPVSSRARHRIDVPVPDPERRARAGGDPDDLHGSGVEPRPVVLQLAEGSSGPAPRRVQGCRMAPAPNLLAARGPSGGAGSGLERDALDGGRLVLPDGERGVPAG